MGEGRQGDSGYVKRLAYEFYERELNMAEYDDLGFEKLSLKKEAERDAESISHWGIFPGTRHEPEVVAAKRKQKEIDKLLFPVVEQIVDIIV